MKHELSLQLKKAGFNQYGRGRHQQLGNVIPNGQVVLYSYDNKSTDENVYEPTLEELLEACGDEFVKLEKYDDLWRVTGNSPLYDEGSNWTYTLNPSEAVAKLWLTLKKDIK